PAKQLNPPFEKLSRRAPPSALPADVSTAATRPRLGGGRDGGAPSSKPSSFPLLDVAHHRHGVAAHKPRSAEIFHVRDQPAARGAYLRGGGGREKGTWRGRAGDAACFTCASAFTSFGNSSLSVISCRRCPRCPRGRWLRANPRGTGGKVPTVSVSRRLSELPRQHRKPFQDGSNSGRRYWTGSLKRSLLATRV
ncbi:unnamed protein product, partial [Ectocarpus sp. 12 AP-2014]